MNIEKLKIETPESLFVYGTLAPGEENERFLQKIEGTWQKGSIFGKKDELGWGKTGGYPAIILDDLGEQIDGLLFSSKYLTDYWSELDEFEGSAYRRVEVEVILANKKTVIAYVYELKNRAFILGG